MVNFTIKITFLTSAFFLSANIFGMIDSFLYIKRLIYSVIIVSFISLPIQITAYSTDFVASYLPIIIIETNGKQILDDQRITASMGIIYNGEDSLNNVNDSCNNYNGRIAIEIRGSTSKQFPKKPYRIETQDSLGENLNVSLLGMPNENDWILYNPYSDKTMIRNVLTYKISRDLNRYASRTRYCELILNGEYKGVYVLMEKIKRDDNRVNISILESTDTSKNEITGGYILKIDKDSGENNEGWRSNGILYQYHYPKPDDINQNQKNYIKNYINQFEETVKFHDQTDSSDSLFKYIDLDSFVDYFIINEISRNIDGYRLSTYFYKDSDDENGKITMGPVWDFNIAFGNAYYYSGFNTDGWSLDYLLEIKTLGVPFWWATIRSDSTFLSKLYYRWFELRKTKLNYDTLFYFIDKQAGLLEEAQKRNFEKWPIIGEEVWPNWYVGNSYTSEINFLKNWIGKRLRWMDLNITLDTTIAVNVQKQYEIPIDFTLHQNYPNPFNPETVIRYSIPLSGNLNSNLVQLKVFDILGQEVKTLLNKKQAPGNYEITFNASELQSGIYFYQLSTLDYSETKKMILLK